MSKKKSKRARHSTQHGHTEASYPRNDQHPYCSLMTLPIDVFKEITSYLTPGDVLALARTNTLLRKTLMQRSAAHMWRHAELNVEMLPPCPSRMSGPQYAALLFTRECSKCGVSVMRALDEYLGVRLCNACRSTGLIAYTEISASIRRYIPISISIKKSNTNTVYALRADVDRLEQQMSGLPDDSSCRAYKRWKSKTRREYNAWIQHVAALSQYIGFTEMRRDHELKGKKQERQDQVMSRLRRLGWKPDDTFMLRQRGEDAWYSLVSTTKPLTDRSWERLYPKLYRLLKRNRENRHDINKNVRQWGRHDCLDELLADMRTNSCPCVEVAESSFPSLVLGENAFLLFPALEELRAYHVFKDLLETDRTIDAMVTKFHACSQLVDNAIVKWRASFDNELVKMVLAGREVRKREVSRAGIELVEESTTLSTKFTESSYKHITRRNSVLFRADTIFKFLDQDGAIHYPISFTSLVNCLRKQLEEQLTGGSILFKHSTITSALEYHEVGARVARALLITLGCPDAAYVEMNAQGMLYVCGRCHYCQPHSWSMIIDHYTTEHNQWISHNLSEAQQRHGIVYNNVHCLESPSSSPLVRLVTTEESEALCKKSYGPVDDIVECNQCVLLELQYAVHGSRKSVAMHLRRVHNIFRPEYGIDYVRWRMLAREVTSFSFPAGELEM